MSSEWPPAAGISLLTVLTLRETAGRPLAAV